MKHYHVTPDYLKPCLMLPFSLPHLLSTLFPSPQKNLFPAFHKLTLHPSGVSLNVISSEAHPWLYHEKKSPR